MGFLNKSLGSLMKKLFLISQIILLLFSNDLYADALLKRALIQVQIKFILIP
jgi:hypothetical protein